ncbi:MAG: TM2 domain-containing protein [Mucilaginibacter polytrichastri]|nr:TM2 domain-containing protein [Mucilaginibacter polytrichastri]
MDINYLLNSIPNLSSQEYAYLTNLLTNMDSEKQNAFLMFYRAERKDPQSIMLLAIIGFFGVAGVHRFVLNQIGMGLLYFFTGGLCLIGTIVDLVNHRNLADEFNRQAADKAYHFVNMR